jgi:DNA-nicking Smr family endonuclease
MDGKVEFSVAATAEYAEGHVLGLDLGIVAQLQSRQFSPEAHIDLHGLNSEQAFNNLVSFFRSSYYKGVRVALVVTGRGLNSMNGVPVLRAKVQEWFTHEPFKRVVLAFCTAKQEDGGAGAFYVLLRKFKKSAGKVRWDAQPTDPDLFL